MDGKDERGKRRMEAAERVRQAQAAWVRAKRGALAVEVELWVELQDACRALLECD